MTNAVDWTATLEEILDRPPLLGQRPFVCDGYPDECHVMIIGTNPATPLEMDWWDCWIPDYGFDYNLFMSRYINTRRKLGRSPLGRTRRILTRFAADCLGALRLKGIETNVYRREAWSEGDLWRHEPADRYPNDDVLYLLMAALQPPKAIIPHGDTAATWLAEQTNTLPPDIRILDRRLPHLSHAINEHFIHICDWVKSLCDEC